MATDCRLKRAKCQLPRGQNLSSLAPTALSVLSSLRNLVLSAHQYVATEVYTGVREVWR